MNAAALIAVVFGLVSVIVSTEAALGAIDAGVKDLAAVGGASTVSVAEAAGAEPALAVEIAPVELRYDPALALVTLTLTVHDPLAGTVPPASTTLAPLLAAVTVPPAHVVAPPAAAVLTRFAGYVSVNAAPVTAVALEFVSVIVSTDVPLMPTTAGANALATPRPASTVSDALAAATLSDALAVVSAPAAMLLL